MLDNYRKNIDLVDKDIISLLEKRKTLTDEVMKFKVSNSLPIIDLQRESEIIAKLQQYNNTIDPLFIQNLYELIFEASTKRRKPLSYLVAGPCAVENEIQINTIARELAAMGVKFLRGGCYKPRTVFSSFQGLEDEGVRLLYNAAQTHEMQTVTEILEASQYERNREFIDVIQIGSRNMTSYGLLKSIGKLSATDNKYVLLKRGLSATINEFLNAADYILQAGNEKVILCLRGIRTFEQIDSNMRFTVDLASIIEIKERSKLPVLFDPSHSTGSSKYVPAVASAALNIGADGLMVEVHNNPSAALVDGKQAVTIQEFQSILNKIKKI